MPEWPIFSSTQPLLLLFIHSTLSVRVCFAGIRPSRQRSQELCWILWDSVWPDELIATPMWHSLPWCKPQFHTVVATPPALTLNLLAAASHCRGCKRERLNFVRLFRLGGQCIRVFMVFTVLFFWCCKILQTSQPSSPAWVSSGSGAPSHNAKMVQAEGIQSLAGAGSNGDPTPIPIPCDSIAESLRSHESCVRICKGGPASQAIVSCVGSGDAEFMRLWSFHRLPISEILRVGIGGWWRYEMGICFNRSKNIAHHIFICSKWKICD